MATAAHRPRISRGTRRAWAITASALVAPFAGAHPTGSRSIDWAWSALLAAAMAYFGCHSKRGPLLFAAGAAVLAARSGVAVTAGAAGVVSAALSTRHLRRRAVLARGVAGGAAMISVLAGSLHQVAPVTVVVGLAVIAPVVVSGWHGTDTIHRRRITRWLIAAGAFAVMATGAAGIGVALSAKKVDSGSTSFRLGLAAARQGQIEVAGAHLADARAQTEAAQKTIDRWGALARLVPGVAQHVGAVSGLLTDVERVGGQAVRTSTVAEDAQLSMAKGRIDVQAIGELTNPFRRLAATLQDVVDGIDSDLAAPLVGPLDRRLRTVRDEAAHALHDARVAEQASTNIPTMLGRDGSRRYLVLFTSPAEARGRFGFPGSFAELTFSDGRLRLGEHGTTSAELLGFVADQLSFDSGDDLLRPYLSFGVTRLMLNATIPPDFPTTAKVVAGLWASSGRRPLDGVIRVDPASLAGLLNFTGPVQVEDLPEPLTATNLERFLIFDQYVQFPVDQAPRREVLETVSRITSERLQTVDLPEPRALVNLFGPLAEAGHLQVATFDAPAQRLLDAIDLDGRLDRPGNRDSLFVTTVNSVGNKIDSFLRKSIRYEATAEDGSLDGRLRVRLDNAAPAAGLPFYVIGSSTQPPLPRGTNRTTLLMFTRVRADRVEVDGTEVSARVERTGGRWLHQISVDIPPGGSVDVVLELHGAAPPGGYELVVDPGGGASPDSYEVEVATEHGGAVTYRGRPSEPTYIR